MTVLASSFNVLLDLNDHYNCDIICSGGYLYSNTKTFYCPEGISMINRTCINKTFITAAGISEKMNVTCIAPHEMDLNESPDGKRTDKNTSGGFFQVWKDFSNSLFSF